MQPECRSSTKVKNTESSWRSVVPGVGIPTRVPGYPGTRIINTRVPCTLYPGSRHPGTRLPGVPGYPGSKSTQLTPEYRYMGRGTRVPRVPGVESTRLYSVSADCCRAYLGRYTENLKTAVPEGPSYLGICSIEHVLTLIHTIMELSEKATLATTLGAHTCTGALYGEYDTRYVKQGFEP
eukprot:887184-Rhodomonas_salina.3